ncbi:MAG: pantetheine-phosphate adenylyltransferase [Deltaproteobacteria bacterium]|nr:pantetheine-phosphate adenylyltransferase [Deltaproteobacteria bacterium]
MKAVFPGSFDPITNGHTDIVRRALSIFDTVVIGVLENPEKETIFSTAERVELIKQEFEAEGDKVVTASFSGLLVDFVKNQDAQVIIRGLRAISDYDYEAQLALMNKTLAKNIETLFLITSESSSYISSSLVRQVAKFGGAVSELVPAHVEKALKEKFKR